MCLLFLARPFAANVPKAKRAILAPNLRVVERLERSERKLMRELRVVRLAHADGRLALRPHALGRVREEVAMRDLRDLVGGGDRWWEGLPGEDSDSGDGGVGADDVKAGYGRMVTSKFQHEYYSVVHWST